MTELARAQESGDDSNSLLAAFGKVRLMCSLSKIDATVALAISTLEDESSVVIFTTFVSVAKEVHRKLKESGFSGELLTGETQQKKRHLIVDNFQTGLSPAFISTFGAGGVGLTLTAASTIILLDRPWTPGDAQQAEDRVRRIGQTKPVKCIWMRAFEIDAQIDALIEEKSQTSEAVVDGRHPVSSPKSSSWGEPTFRPQPRISIDQLLRSIAPAKLLAKVVHSKEPSAITDSPGATKFDITEDA